MVPSVTMKLGTRRIVVPSPFTMPTTTPIDQHERDGREHPALVVADVVAGDDDLGRDDGAHREVELAGDDDVVLPMAAIAIGAVRPMKRISCGGSAKEG